MKQKKHLIGTLEVKVLITPEANMYLHTHLTDPSILAMIGEVLSFTSSIRYRKHHAIAKICPSTRPICYRIDGKLGFCHWVAQSTVLLFIPPPWERRGEMHADFFDREFARSSEMHLT